MWTALLLLPLATLAQNQLQGVVRDARTNEPLSGATVTLIQEKKTAVTDTQGIFQFADVRSYEAEIRLYFHQE